MVRRRSSPQPDQRGGSLFRVIAFTLTVLLTGANASAQRLPTTVQPQHYDLAFDVDLAAARFSWRRDHSCPNQPATTRIVLNAVA